MVVLGYPDTTHFTMEKWASTSGGRSREAQCAARRPNLPYHSYDKPEQALANARTPSRLALSL